MAKIGGYDMNASDYTPDSIGQALYAAITERCFDGKDAQDAADKRYEQRFAEELMAENEGRGPIRSTMRGVKQTAKSFTGGIGQSVRNATDPRMKRVPNVVHDENHNGIDDAYEMY